MFSSLPLSLGVTLELAPGFIKHGAGIVGRGIGVSCPVPDRVALFELFDTRLFVWSSQRRKSGRRGGMQAIMVTNQSSVDAQARNVTRS